MSQRRSRRSLGLPAAHSEDQQVQFDDFRRRHSKQNREIIHENISRKSLIQSLQDQIAALQVELLQVRQQNAVLQRRMTRMEDGHEALQDQATLQALDHIIAAMPALAALRHALDTKPPPVVAPSVPFNRTVGNPIATKPAATGEMHKTLSTLGETEEEVDSPRRHRNRRSPRKSDDTYYPSVSARTSSSPLNSPSPKRTPRKQRRRRESGLLMPRPATPERSPELELHEDHQPAQFADAEDHVPDTRLTRPWQPIPSAPTVTEHTAEAIVTPVGRARNVRDIAAKLDAATRDAGRVVVIEDKRRSPESSLTLSTAPGEDRDQEQEAQDEGRTRRARASVSYKEPSLRAKMRKPDGVAVEDMLGLRRLDSGVRRKSALPRSTKLATFPFGEGDVESQELPSPTKPESLVRPAAPSPRRASASPESADDEPPLRFLPAKAHEPRTKDKESLKAIPRSISAKGLKSASRRPTSIKRDALKPISSGNDEHVDVDNGVSNYRV